MKSILKTFILLLITSACVFCNRLDVSTLTSENIENEGLTAVLIVNKSIVSSENELIISACLINKSSKNIEIEKDYILENPILSLCLINQFGDTLRTIPPVTPNKKQETQLNKILKPGEKHSVEFNHLSLFNPALPKGKYSVAMRSITSNNVYFEIK